MARRRWLRVSGSRRRRYFWRIARIASAHGVPTFTAWTIAFVCALMRFRPALAFALVEQESGFRHIFGHDPGGLFPGKPVTRDRYLTLVDRVKRGGTSNGVGLAQITYGPYLIEHPRLWLRAVNVWFGLKLLRESISKYGLHKGLAAYNGGPTPPAISYEYATSVIAKSRVWAGRFSR